MARVLKECHKITLRQPKRKVCVTYVNLDDVYTCIIFVSDGAKGFGGKKISMPQFMKKDEGMIMKAVLAGSKINFDLCYDDWLILTTTHVVSDGIARKISMPQFMKKDDGR